MRNKVSILIFFALLFLILAVRTVGLLNNNALFIFDSARDFLFVKKIVADHHLILIGPSSGGLQGYFQGAIWYYMLSIPFAISGGNPISGQWFMAIMSAMSAIGAFYILKRVSNIYSAFLGLIILGFAGYSVATSQFVWNPYPIVWVMPFYFLAVYWTSKHLPKGIVLLSILEGLIIHFEVIYGLGTLPAYLFLLIYGIQHLKKEKLKYLLVSGLLFAMPMIPTLLFDLRHHFLITNSIATTIKTGGANLSHKEGDAPNSASNRIKFRLGDLYQYTGGSVTENKELNLLFFALFLTSIFLLRKKEQKTMILSLAVLISPFIVFLLLKYNVWAYYWIGSSPFYAIFFAFTIGKVLKNYNKQQLLIILSLTLFIFYHPWTSLSYWKDGVLKDSPQVLSTQLKVIKTIYKDAKGEEFSVYEQTPPVYDYVYRYLLWWQGSKVYHYVPKNEKQKNVYVVLEGVSSDPDAKYFVRKTLNITAGSVKEFSFGVRFPKVLKFNPSLNEKPVDPNFFPQI